MPAVMSTEAATAVAGETSPRPAQAAIATSTVPRQATRSRIECSGWPGLLRPADRLEDAHCVGPRGAPVPHRARRQPASRDPPVGDRRQHRTRSLQGAEEDGCARRPAGHDSAEGAFGDALGLVGVRRAAPR